MLIEIKYVKYLFYFNAFISNYRHIFLIIFIFENIKIFTVQGK